MAPERGAAQKSSSPRAKSPRQSASSEEFRKAADAAVEALDNDLEPVLLLQDVPGWNEAFVEAVRTRKDRYRGSKDLKNLLRIAGELLYGKDIHWAMELVQNAEDAKAKAISFEFQSDKVIVRNDGDPFEARDVWAICSAGHSPKRNKIGFFGIGFKSVYTITDLPEIYSGQYALRIEGKLYPMALSPRDQRTTGAEFVLPVMPSALPKLAAMIRSLASTEFAQVLLTLTNIGEITILDKTGTGLSGSFKRSVLRQGKKGDWDECEIEASWDWAPTRIWRRLFHQTEPVPAGVSREGRNFEATDRSMIVLAKPLDQGPSDLRLNCFLPTAVNSQLRWLVQADFEPSASREQLRQSPWNEWLFHEVGVALQQAVNVSCRELGDAPWELVPLSEEVTDPQQRVAYEVAKDLLRNTPFVSTRRGWRSPSASAWGEFPGVPDVVREPDLEIVAGFELSYVRDEILGPISATEPSRAEEVLDELGARAISCADVVSLFAADNARFTGGRRDSVWWIRALSLMADFATGEERGELAATACIPVRGGQRVRPSPAIADKGYLVAFSRSDLTQDLRSYLGESQVFLVEEFISPRIDARRKGQRLAEVAEQIVAISKMLEGDPFNVAPEAGPYHVINHLVVPRMASLSEARELTAEQAEQAWGLFEYVRQKWPTYASEYRRKRNDRATDSMIGLELGQKVSIVANVGRRRARLRVLRPVSETYVSTELLGWGAMDVVLAEDTQVATVDPIHKDVLRVTAKRRSGQPRKRSPQVVEFLRLLGAPVGPRVTRVRLTQASPSEIPWVDWSAIPPESYARVGLEGDWDSPDIARLGVRWPAMSQRAKARVGAALLRSIEDDWPRLAPSATAAAQYFRRTWTWYGTAAPTWIGRLRRFAWVPSIAGTLERPTDLVVDSSSNRLAVGGHEQSVLNWRAATVDALIALGVRERPDTDRVIDTLVALRADDALSRADKGSVAGACYQTLAEHLRGSGGVAAVEKHITTRMRGGSGRGLVYAPPPEGVQGEEWWAPSRLLRNDATQWAGPYLGHLAGRYRTASGLWDSLNIARDLSIEMACDVIARDLVRDEDKGRVHEYYGRLVSFIETSVAEQSARPETPALTMVGWKNGHEAWWTNRDELRDALATHVPWWQPGSRDPSSVRKAAAFLGIREMTSEARGGPLRERWQVSPASPIEMDDEDRWQLAVRTWPHVIRQDTDPANWVDLDELSAAVAELRPALTERISVQFTFTSDAKTKAAAIRPTVALRQKEATLAAISTDELFSSRAAAALANLVPSHQRTAAIALTSLLSMAAHDPMELERRAAQHAVSRYQHRDFHFTAADFDPNEVSPSLAVKVSPVRKPAPSKEMAEAPFVPLADTMRYGLIEVTSAQPSGYLPPLLAPRMLKPPVSTGASEGGLVNDNALPPARMRYANSEIEAAARPFLEEYELETRGCTLERQGPNVGADYLASDGRYIELKAFSGAAPDAVELEPPEWRAAQHPEVGDHYWVYVVEHLRDGQPPLITAVFNPVLDDSTSKESTGKLRVRGWKNARVQQAGRFGERAAPAEATDVVSSDRTAADL